MSQPKPRTDGEMDGLVAMAVIRRLSPEEVESRTFAAMTAAREAGHTWQQIGAAWGNRRAPTVHAWYQRRATRQETT